MSHYPFVLIFLFFIATPVFSQDTDPIIYSNKTTKEIDPAGVTYLYIRVTDSNSVQFREEIKLFRQLLKIEFDNIENPAFGPDLTGLSKLETLVVRNSSGINLDLFLESLPAINLKKLVLDGDSIKVIPKKIKKLTGLSSLTISNNNVLDLETSISRLEQLNNLKELTLTWCNIYDLPSCINKLNKLETLDLSNNYLTDLPDGISALKNLQNINLENNMIYDPLGTFTKLKDLSLINVKLDELYEGELPALKSLLPGAVIIEYIDTIEEMDFVFTENDTISPELSTSTDTLDMNIISETQQNAFYGKFIVRPKEFKVYSLAYLHYAPIFGSPRFEYSFDSLSFDERFLDTNYLGVYRIIRRDAWNSLSRGTTNRFITFDTDKGFRIYRFKHHKKGEIWFVFYDKKSKRNVYISTCNPEMNAFRGMVWVYNGNLSNREFRNQLMKKRYWTDIRLDYDENLSDFIITLKNKSGFYELRAYPRMKDKSKPLSKSQQSYLQRYRSYIRSLDKRSDRFQKRLLRDKKRYETTYQASFQNTWDHFRNLYMSDEEKAMTRDEWLAYYDRIMANEKRALYNATASIDNIKRSFELERFMCQDFIRFVYIDSTYTMSRTRFTDEIGNFLPVQKFIVLNTSDRTYYWVQHSMATISNEMVIHWSPSTAIIVELRNGDTGIVFPGQLKESIAVSDGEYVFTVELLDQNISSVGQVYDLLGL